MIRICLLAAFVYSAINNIIISSPLVTEFEGNEIPYFYANFGQISYGKTISLDLLILNDSLCNYNQQFQHLTKPTYIVIQINYIQTCSYTKRALLAQSIGAKGIIIATDQTLYQTTNVIKSDDGNGKKVHISCFFITPQSFTKLQKLSKIQIIAKFPVPQETISTLTLFLSASKRSTYTFLRQFKKQYSYFKNHIKIDLIYQTIECPYCDSNNCYFQGVGVEGRQTYCTFDYSDRQTDVGQLIVIEQLNQYNIFLQHGILKWLDYMDLFDENCLYNWKNIDQCVKNIKNKLKIGTQASFNHLEELLTWRIKQIRIGFDRFPEVSINNMIYEGNLNASQIFNAVCDSLLQPPKYCIDKSSLIDQPKKSNHLLYIIMSSIVALIFFTGIGICIYRRFIKSQITRDMASKVDELVANYANSLTNSKKRKHERLVETFDQEI